MFVYLDYWLHYDWNAGYSWSYGTYEIPRQVKSININSVIPQLHFEKFYLFLHRFKQIDNKFIRPLLIREKKAYEPKILETYSRLAKKDAMEQMERVGSTLSAYPRSMSALFRNYTSNNLASNSNSGYLQYEYITIFLLKSSIPYVPVCPWWTKGWISTLENWNTIPRLATCQMPKYITCYPMTYGNLPKK
jgi:hypothetical protein